MAQLLTFQLINIMNKSQIARIVAIKIVFNKSKMEILKIIILKKLQKEITSSLSMLQLSIKTKGIINNR